MQAPSFRDSRPSSYFINFAFTSTHNVHVVWLSKPIQVEEIDGWVSAFLKSDCRRNNSIGASSTRSNQEELAFYLIASPQHLIVLDLLWLEVHNMMAHPLPNFYPTYLFASIDDASASACHFLLVRSLPDPREDQLLFIYHEIQRLCWWVQGKEHIWLPQTLILQLLGWSKGCSPFAIRSHILVVWTKTWGSLDIPWYES